jgi:hypothetical protein
MMTKEETAQIRVKPETRTALNATAKIRKIASYEIADEIIKNWLEKHEKNLWQRIKREHARHSHTES